MNAIRIIAAPDLRPGMIIIDGYARTMMVLEQINIEKKEQGLGFSLPIYHYKVAVLGRYSRIGNYGDTETTIQGNGNAGYRLLNPEGFNPELFTL